MYIQFPVNKVTALITREDTPIMRLCVAYRIATPGCFVIRSIY